MLFIYIVFILLLAQYLVELYMIYVASIQFSILKELFNVYTVVNLVSLVPNCSARMEFTRIAIGIAFFVVIMLK